MQEDEWDRDTQVFDMPLRAPAVTVIVNSPPIPDESAEPAPRKRSPTRPLGSGPGRTTITVR